MARMNKSVVTKALFSIGVVGAVATAGVVGFAQASNSANDNRAEVLAASTGYGGIGEQIRAAVEAYQRALRAATAQFQEDVQACVDNLNGSSADVSSFRNSSMQAASDFSASTASPSTYSNLSKFDSNMKAQDANLETRLEADSARLIASYDSTNSSRENRNEFRQCMKDARQDLRNSMNEARQDFKDALREILS